VGNWSGLSGIMGLVLLGAWLTAVVCSGIRLSRRLAVAPKTRHRRLVMRWGLLVGAATSAWLWLFGGGLSELQRALHGGVAIGSALVTGGVLVGAGMLSGCMLALVVIKKYKSGV